MENEKKKSYLKNGIILIVVFFVGMASMYGIIYKFPTITTETITKLQKDVTVTDSGIADAVEKLYDAVVVVNTYVNGKAYASGSGFVYKTEGDKAYILTNNHVINGADDVYVTFTDGDIVKTEIVGGDLYADIAVLAVPKEQADTIASIGKSETLRLGDTVFAIGAPITSAYSWSVTRGIVSGKDRLVEVQIPNSNSNATMVVNTLQTDTAINSGNSGGPLANANGEVIGITSIKLATSTIEGMSFAIPIEEALNISEQLIKGNSVERPYLGIYMLDVTNAYYYREYYNLINEANITKGVVVTEVEDKYSASLAGIQKNDIITKIDGNEISSSAYLRYYLFKHQAGDTMNVTIIRNNKEIDIKVKLTAK